jgi:hypothetical protein
MAALLSLAMVATACNTREPTGEQQARVRNQPPAECGQADFDQCPALETQPCGDGSEPVIDYSSDCCPHFSCQPICVAAQACPMRPAPSCPAGTTLWIGTALEDCCPAYRCEPTTECTQERSAACPLSYPYCGDGIEPIVVGKTADCCPIYQCPCDQPVPNAAGEYTDLGTKSDPGLCGCTFPGCPPGMRPECRGDNVCGYPCECVPVGAECVSDADCPQYDCDPMTDCGVQMRCDTSMCLPPPGCDPSTGQLCPPVCGGICVGNTTDGCKSDAQCPYGQRCEMMCAGWACAGYPDDPSCACPPDLSTCTCDPSGTCYAEECAGQCVPAAVCGGACGAPRCDNPIEVGIDECGCPLFECLTCTVPQGGNACPAAGCYCAQQVGLDPATCCPIVYCPPVAPPEACPAGPAPVCRVDGDCPAGSVCVNGVCADADSAGT